MAEVTGRTRMSIDQLINDTIVDGQLVANHLILRSRGGAEIDAGLLDLNVTPVSPLDFYPIGSVYISVLPTNPIALFGGTWVQFAKGRVLVGQDPSQTEFDTVEETGGSKTHTLTTAEMPSHTHILERKTAAGTLTGVTRGGTTLSADGTTASSGSGSAHNNLQPYLVVFMFKRTA